MRDQIIRTGLAAVALSLALPAAPAGAQFRSQSTRVSSAGADSGYCSRSSPPCRTLSYALEQTSSNGQVQCIDSGDFTGGSIFGENVITITRSVIIDCSEVSATLEDTIVIDDSATAAPGSINVVLRGLRLNGIQIFTTAVRFSSGYSLTVDGLIVANYRGQPFPNAGILFAPTRAARLHVANSIIANNGLSAAGPGILIAPTGPGYASVTLENVQLVGNTIGLSVFTTSEASSSTNVVINRSVISGGNYGVSVGAIQDTRGAGITITNSSIGGAAIAGLSASGPLAQIRVGTSTIAGNSTGIERSNGGVIASYGDNRLIGNGVNGSFNGFPTEN